MAVPEKVVGAMNGDIEAAGKLLAELRVAYRDLPQQLQVHVAHLMRESLLHQQLRQQACELTPGIEAVIGVFNAQLRNS
jgi:hypothetical protein